MKKQLVGALLAVTSFLSFSQPADWESMMYTPYESVWYAIPKSLSSTGSGSHTMWIVKDLMKGYVDPQDPNARSMQLLVEIDCYGNTVRIVRAVHWTGNNATGNSRVMNGPPGPWMSSPKGSNTAIGGALAIACKGK